METKIDTQLYIKMNVLNRCLRLHSKRNSFKRTLYLNILYHATKATFSSSTDTFQWCKIKTQLLLYYRHNLLNTCFKQLIKFRWIEPTDKKTYFRLSDKSMYAVMNFDADLKQYFKLVEQGAIKKHMKG